MVWHWNTRVKAGYSAWWIISLNQRCRDRNIPWDALSGRNQGPSKILQCYYKSFSGEEALYLGASKSWKKWYAMFSLSILQLFRKHKELSCPHLFLVRGKNNYIEPRRTRRKENRINFTAMCPIHTIETHYIFNIVKENFIQKEHFDFLGMTFYLQRWLLVSWLASLFVCIRGIC